jgi:endo-1,4-beta-xylanase
MNGRLHIPTSSRRGLLAGLGAVALAACGETTRGETARGEEAGPRNPAPLKSSARFPVGCAVSSDRLADPVYAALLARNFSQVSPEWEMKMEYILRDDGGMKFDAPDAIAAFARDHGMRLFCHTLVWYAEEPEAFKRLDGQPAAFASAYRDYIAAVVGRYRGQAVGWDVVNEAVSEDGDSLRESLWTRNLGQIDHMRRAYDLAHEADPGAVLLINDYFLESKPNKRATFMRLVETLLKAGAPLGAIGTQTHLDADLDPKMIDAAFRDLSSLGLPIHLSEMDISLNRANGLFTSRPDLIAAQRRLAHHVAEVYAALRPEQRFAFTIWGLRDSDSWLRRPNQNPTPPWDQPLLFDDQGRAKPMFEAVASGFA